MTVTRLESTPRAADDVAELWRRYRNARDQAARASLVNRYLGLVHAVTRQIAGRIGGAVDADDLLGPGMVGLLQALDSFDPARGVAFSTFALRRVHGEVIDELRRRDWAPRSVRARARRLQLAARALEARLGRRPSEAEMATALDIDLPTYWAWRNRVHDAAVVSLQSASLEEERASPAVNHPLAREENSLDRVTEDETRDRIQAALAMLPVKQRQVVSLYYFEELTLREIGEVMGITESRVCQIRSAAVSALRGLMNR
ncbi:MAG: sigma-70 family RNA polymerase sigma factor [Gemmatimonadales bacterium]